LATETKTGIALFKKPKLSPTPTFEKTEQETKNQYQL